MNRNRSLLACGGQRHLKHIIKHCKPFYNKMLGEHTLYDYLLQLDRDAEENFNRLIKQMAEREVVTEKLKADSQMVWVGRMNNIRLHRQQRYPKENKALRPACE